MSTPIRLRKLAHHHLLFLNQYATPAPNTHRAGSIQNPIMIRVSVLVHIADPPDIFRTDLVKTVGRGSHHFPCNSVSRLFRTGGAACHRFPKFCDVGSRVGPDNNRVHILIHNSSLILHHFFKCSAFITSSAAVSLMSPTQMQLSSIRPPRGSVGSYPAFSSSSRWLGTYPVF